MIPRLIHFTWKTQELPRQMAAYYAQWQRLHPGWEVRLWTDASMRDFVAESYPEFLAVYDGYPRMIQRADAFRYLVLGKLGGIYADLDVEPLQSCEPLLGLGCFVGVEPLEHIAEDRVHQGVPILLSNAFMGSVPHHPAFEQICKLMPRLLDQEIFYSTGPSMLTAAVLHMPWQERPRLLMPGVWSPLLSNGRPTCGDVKLARTAAEVGDVVTGLYTALVSHKWETTWVPWYKRQSRLGDLLQVPTRVKWWMRRQRHRHLAQTVIPDPRQLYLQQTLEPVQDRPSIHIAVNLSKQTLSEALAVQLAGLSYPSERLTTSLHVGADDTVSAATALAAGLSAVVVRADASAWSALNAGLAAGSPRADYTLLVDGGVIDVPPDALERLLSGRRPVVAANCVNQDGRTADRSLFRYKDGAPFKILYKDGAVSGSLQRQPVYRKPLAEQTAFSILPLDGVGESFVLVRRDVIEAGVRFAETPYKLHLGGEAFGIMARDKGFEVAGLPGLRVIKAG